MLSTRLKPAGDSQFLHRRRSDCRFREAHQVRGIVMEQVAAGVEQCHRSSVSVDSVKARGSVSLKLN